MCCSVLYCTVLYCTLFYCILLCCTVLCIREQATGTQPVLLLSISQFNCSTICTVNYLYHCSYYSTAVILLQAKTFPFDPFWIPRNMFSAVSLVSPLLALPLAGWSNRQLRMWCSATEVWILGRVWASWIKSRWKRRALLRPTSLVYCLLRAVLIEQLFPPIFPLFSQEKQEKQEKQVTFPKFGNWTEGKIFGRLRIPIFGNKIWKIWKYKKLREKKNWKFSQNVLRWERPLVL